MADLASRSTNGLFVIQAYSGSTKKKIYYPNLDYFYGPYSSVAAAWTALSTTSSVNTDPKFQLVVGKTVGITQSDGSIVEYWFEKKATCADDLVKKVPDYEDIMFYKGLLSAAQFAALDTSILLKNTCYIPTEDIQISETVKAKKGCLLIWNGAAWNYTSLSEEEHDTLVACATPETVPGEEFSKYQEIMSSLAWLTNDTEVVTVGALKVILGQLLSNYPRIEDVI